MVYSPDVGNGGLQGRIQSFIYGTAWKEHETQRLVELALDQGFRSIDTANQRKHYDEAAVGLGISAAIDRGLVSRQELFLQTKFTFHEGQDHRLPYELAAPTAKQVQQSFASSLSHLKTEYLDSYLIHGPTQRRGLGNRDWDAWRAMEELQDDGRVRQLGISNVSLEQLQLLVNSARIKPRFVQNRCYAVHGWDRLMREYCRANGIIYQGFSLLTANREALTRSPVATIAKGHNRSVSQVVFRFALQVGMHPLTGTTNVDHMRADLDALHFELTQDELEQIERLALDAI